jgi:hypothetical protein
MLPCIDDQRPPSCGRFLRRQAPTPESATFEWRALGECLLAFESLHQGKHVPKGVVVKLVKLIAASLLCVAMTSQASNFAGLAAMNESGVTTTQTAGHAYRRRVFSFCVPTSPDKPMSSQSFRAWHADD